LKPPRHDRFPSLNILEALPWQAADSEKVTLVNMGIQSRGDYGKGFATLQPTPYPLCIGVLLRNLKRAEQYRGCAEKTDFVK
jgi:hypothetical protein